MFAAFKVVRRHSPIDPVAECGRVTDLTVVTHKVVTILALSAGICPVAVLAPAVLRAVVLFTATVHRSTSAILKKVADRLFLTNINHHFRAYA